MNIQKINWKINFKNPQDIVPLDFVKVFNRWIPNSPEIFIDVADYKHVADGPWILLAGYHTDYALDNADKKLGFLMNQKSAMMGNNQSKLKDTFCSYIKHALALLKDDIFQGKTKLDLTQVEFTVNDRGLVPNTTESYKALSEELNAFSTQFLNGATLKHHDDKRRRFSVSFLLDQEIILEDLLKKIS